MRIRELTLSKSEIAAVYTLAGAKLLDGGMSSQQVVTYLKSLTPQNVVRVALGLDTRTRGGKREGAGAKPKSQPESAETPETGK